MDKAPRRRMLRFRLRTLLILIAVASPLLAWSGYSLKWIRGRHQALADTPMFPSAGCMMTDWEPIPAPGWLRLFGETGRDRIDAVDAPPAQIERLTRLFPEAQVVNFPPMKKFDSAAMQNALRRRSKRILDRVKNARR